MQILARLAAILLIALPTASAAGERHVSGSLGLFWEWGSIMHCNGDCSFTVLGGRQTSVNMTDAFGVENFTDGKYGFKPVQPIWEWPWEDSVIVGAAYSRRIAAFGHVRTGEIISLEGEVGAAKRFGDQDEFEVWGAFYLRYHWFPWNHIVKTSVGVSTGLSWASGVSAFELVESETPEGSQLLHYLSPEISFALPDRPETELVFRFHHRSGGSDFFGPDNIFNNANSGSQYLTVGTRIRF